MIWKLCYYYRTGNQNLIYLFLVPMYQIKNWPSTDGFGPHCLACGSTGRCRWHRCCFDSIWGRLAGDPCDLLDPCPGLFQVLFQLVHQKLWNFQKGYIWFGPKCLHRYQSQTQDSKQIQNCGHIVKKKFIRSLFSPASSTGNLHQVVTCKIWGIKMTQESTEI